MSMSKAQTKLLVPTDLTDVNLLRRFLDSVVAELITTQQQLKEVQNRVSELEAQP